MNMVYSLSNIGHVVLGNAGGTTSLFARGSSVRLSSSTTPAAHPMLLKHLLHRLYTTEIGFLYIRARQKCCPIARG